MYFYRNPFLLVLLAFFAIVGCEKEPGLIGSEIQPPGSQPDVTILDSFQLEASYVLEDSVLSSRTIASTAGVIYQPAFGASTAGFGVHLRLPVNNVEFDPSAQVDSAFLYLVYYGDGYYGDPTQSVTLDVHELLTPIDNDSSYYTETILDFDPTVIGSFSGKPNPSDTSMTIDGAAAPAHVRIPIDLAWAQKIFDASGEPELEDNEQFLEFIRGIYVRGTSGQALLYFDLLNTFSNLVIHYTVNDTVPSTFSLQLNNECQRVNTFQHDYSGTLIDPNNPPASASEAYTHGMGGVRSTFFIPELDSMMGADLAINSAELLLHVSPNFVSPYPMPSQLFLVVLDSANNNVNLIDQLESSTLIGGTLNETERYYRFNIPRHISAVINNQIENRRLALLPSGRAIFGNSVVLAGGAFPDPEYRPSLKLVVTQPK